ncbi:hypothetical protein T4B_2366 [Trichinella pseudospiralis]|uniref:Uncharacterized protein n=3 Tax=Trichinella pseudospiralis TaxID=6337 RepID=A0A0V1J756_TRIPS|nr:hypothetical protein T4D_2806 [Trichinella pseudospiralis]KRZ30796.1 hypothetical protein T4B_2366 [Trichinella pseudospiralis]
MKILLISVLIVCCSQAMIKAKTWHVPIYKYVERRAVFVGRSIILQCNMKKEFENLIPYNSSWSSGIQWHRLTPHGLLPIAYADAFPMVYRNYQILNGTLKIIHAQEHLHSGWYMCTVNKGPHQLLAIAIALSVEECKFEDFLHKDYCKFGVCKISKDDFNLTELNCSCEPGYSGFGCIYRTKILKTYLWLSWIPVFVITSTTIIVVTIIFFIVDARKKSKKFAKHRIITYRHTLEDELKN